MSNLLDRLSETSRRDEVATLGEASKQLDPAALYSIGKVAERMLGGNKPKQATKWDDNYYFTLLDQDFMSGVVLEPQKLKELNAAKADLCLITTHKGLLRIMTHLQFEEHWNLLGERERASTMVTRKYWLGNGFEIDLTGARDKNGIAQRISDRLVRDVVVLSGKYKAFREGKEKRDLAILPIKGGRTTEIDKGTWSERVYYGWSGVGIDQSTYLNDLLISLYENQSIPSNCPLTDYEKEQILEKLGFKNTKQTAKKEAA